MKKNVIARGEMWHIQVCLKGRRIRFSTKLKASKENKEYILRNFERLIEEHLNPPKIPPKKTQKESLEYYLNRALHNAKALRDGSQITYKQYYNFLLGYFGGICVENIGREEIEKFYLYLGRQNISKVRARSIVRFLKHSLGLALYDEAINRNPVYPCKFSTLKESKKIEPFNLSEVKAILEIAKGKDYPKWFCNLLKVAFFTGMRCGELFALRKEDIDFTRNKISITRAIKQHNGKASEPKTTSGIREIDLLPPVREALLAQIESQGGKTYLFSHTRGNPFRSSADFRDIWASVLKKAGLKYRTFYTTRHSFASIMLSEGEEAMWVSKTLGHENLNITLEFYAKFLENEQKPRAVFLNALAGDE